MDGLVPDAKTVENVKKFYEAKVSMKRGCTATDIMNESHFLLHRSEVRKPARPFQLPAARLCLSKVIIMNKVDYLPKIKKIFIFRGLADSELHELLNISDIETYEEDGVKIVSEGEISPHLFSIIEGAANVSVEKKEGGEAFIGSLGQGEVFGEAGIFLKAPRTANVVCAEKAVIFRIHRQKLFGFIKKFPNAGMKIFMLIIYSLLKKLRTANQELAFDRHSDLDQNEIDDILQGL